MATPVLVARARRLGGDPSTVLLVAQIVAAGTAFVINILAARTLDPSGRGELALLLQIAYLSTLGLLLGTDRSVVAVLTGRPLGTIARTAVRMLLAPSAVGLLAVVAVLTLPIPGLESWSVRLGLALAFTVMNAFSRAVRSIAIAAERKREYFWFTLVDQGLLFLGIGLLVVLGVHDVTLWMAVYLAAGIPAPALWLVRWVRSGGGNAVPAGEQAEGPAVRREGLALLPATVAHSGTLRIDRLLLAGLASTGELGIYAAVATMTELIAWPMMAYADSRLGRWRQAHDGGRLPLRTVLVATLAYGVAASVVLSVLLSLTLVPLLGEAYRPALGLVVPLVAASAVFGMSQILVNMLTAVRRAGLASTVEVLGLGISVVLYVTLISRYGAAGAAYGSLLGYLSCLVLAATFLAVTLRRRTSSSRG